MRSSPQRTPLLKSLSWEGPLVSIGLSPRRKAAVILADVYTLENSKVLVSNLLCEGQELSGERAQNTHFRECYTCFGCETKTGLVRSLVIFQGTPMFSHIIKKVSARAFD